MDILGQFVLAFLKGFADLLLLPWHIINWAQLPTLKERLNVVLVAGMSAEFLFVVLAAVLILLAAGLYSRRFLRGLVFGLERFNGAIGKFAAWFALIMVIQQVLIIAMGQVFRGNDLIFSPFGMIMTSHELQWLSGQLKFYNAILIAIASAYTFIEGGHVRVDLIYSTVRHRTKKLVDLIGTLIFLFPSSILLWWFSWPIATNALFAQRPLNIWSETARFRGFRFESSGTAEFTWVWSFKVLIVIFAGLMFIVAVSFFFRNILALLERDEEIPAHYSLDSSASEDGEPHPTH
ncbi:TRAP transporter small permease subunit [Pelagibius sp. Alg239-R121]|uniref:TRAP transporter small permease subunit n=1 Tax=Pelagibius sp. Alg239-R121 TaxID=2993448 RepID=UPI0024A6E69A|nr:TRAP transporter small permease subunit [Pelagibius sp. Alg239-R121]